MPFDIRTYKSPKEDNGETQFWTQNYLRKVDEFFPKINSECEYLAKGMNERTEDAFHNKIEAWKAFVEATQRLCSLYRVKNAKCLSKAS